MAGTWARILLSAGVVAGAAAVTVGLAACLTPLPDVATTRATVLVDAVGRQLSRIGPGAAGRPVPLAEVPPTFVRALLDTEDRTFYTNPGIDPASMVRAALADLRARGVVQGGSTLTQQLAKNAYLSQARTVSRKIAELFWALALTAHLSKSQILDRYLNTVYYGEGAYGLDSAARVYFGVPPARLSLAQAALLAGLVEAPSSYDPYLHPGLARARRRMVLSSMVAAGDLSPKTARHAAAEPLALAGLPLPTAPDLAPYATDLALSELAQRAPALAPLVSRGGYRLRLTLDLGTQAEADRAYAAHLPDLTGGTSGAGQPEAALVALDPRSGAIRALIGGRDHARTPFDRAVFALRQPGSSFKAVLYAALLSTGRYTASSVIDDAPVAFPGAVRGQLYRPQNADRVFHGPILMRRALAISDNVAAVKFAAALGLGPVVRQARRFGVTSPLSANLTLALGSSPVTPLEMAQVYSALANGGRRVAPYLVAQVSDASGRVVYRAAPAPARAVDPRVAFILSDLLRSVLRPGGTGAALGAAVPAVAFGKTGTSQNQADAWFVGGLPRLVAAVWVGYDRGGRSLPGEGATLAGPIWADLIGAYAASHPPRAPRPPRGLVMCRVSTIDGLLPNRTSPTERNGYLTGTQPVARSPVVYTGPPSGPADPGYWYWQAHRTVPTGLPLSPVRPVAVRP